MQTLVLLTVAIVVGMLLSVQPPLNGMLARVVGSPYGAAVISVSVALISILCIAFFTGVGDISRKSLLSVPWWVYFSGTVGAIFVASGAVIAPATGALAFFVCIVAGQLLGSVLADHFGAFGLVIRPVSLLRLMGLAMVVSGAVLVVRG